MKPENENLEELFGKFMNKPQAGQADDDIAAGEQLISKYPAPKPDAKLLSAINLQVNKKLQKTKHRSLIYSGYWASAAAAIILIVGLISITRINKPQQPRQITDSSVIPAALDGEDLWQDDTSLSLLYSMLEEIEDEADIVKNGWNSSYSTDAEELEIEFLEISNDFWKG